MVDHMDSADAEGLYSAAIQAFNRKADLEGRRLAGQAEANGDERARISNAALKAYERGDHYLAAELWEEGAKLGCLRSFFNLGLNADEQGDTATAQRYFESAAAGGHAEAMNFLGVYAERAGETENANDWFQKSRALGNPIALSYLARAASNNGDEQLAQTLHEEAASAGVEPSIMALLRASLPGHEDDDEPSESLLRYATLAQSAGNDSYLLLINAWQSERRARSLCEAMSTAQLMSAARDAIDHKDFSASYVYFTEALIQGLDNDTEGEVLVQMIRDVLIPSGRLVEALVWSRFGSRTEALISVAEEVNDLLYDNSDFIDLVRLPENVSWKDAEKTCAWLYSDPIQVRYDEIVAFSVMNKTAHNLIFTERSLAPWFRGFLSQRLRLLFSPNPEVFAIAVYDYIQYLHSTPQPAPSSSHKSGSKTWNELKPSLESDTARERFCEACEEPMSLDHRYCIHCGHKNGEQHGSNHR